jgi:hypothetical protein
MKVNPAKYDRPIMNNENSVQSTFVGSMPPQ